MDQLERAARDGLRVAVRRRGVEFVVTARRVELSARGERLIGYLPMTGSEMTFELSQVESFEVLS